MHRSQSKDQRWQKILMGIFPLIAIWGGYSLYTVTLNDEDTEPHPTQSMNKSSLNQQTALQLGRKYKLISSECNTRTVECKPLNRELGHIQFADPKVIVETPNTVKFLPVNFTDNEIKKVEAELIGENMFMGRVPITFSRIDNHWQGSFFLGMCSEKQMLWRMTLTITFDDNSQEQAYALFDSYWPE